MAENPFDSLRQLSGNQLQSVQWYENQVKKLGTINTNQLLKDGVKVSQIYPGHMYMFYYNPKFKDQLPYYDRFPLVLPFKKIAGGFLGLNLHYIPYNYRFKMLRHLSQFEINKNIPEQTRLRLNWTLLEGASKFKPLMPCVKHYIYEHLRSRFVKIPHSDWVIASQLPVERFTKARKQQVWKDSKRTFI